MKIKTLPSSHHNETFTSWIYRCAINPKSIKVTLDDVDSYVRNWRGGREYIDVDFDLKSDAFLFLCKSIDLDFGRTIPFFSLPGNTIPLSYWFRYAYCPQCLNSDVQVFGFPYWRKEWCYIDCPCCLLHGCLLSILNDPAHADAHKPWRAFSSDDYGYDILLDSSYRAAGRRYRKPVLPVLMQYALRTQRFLCAARQSERVTLPRSRRRVNSGCVLQCSNILFCTFLSVRTERQDGGIARQLLTEIPDKIYHINLTKRSRMLLGAEEATPYLRLIAMLLTGWVLGVIDDSEFNEIRGPARDQFYWLPNSIKDLGIKATSFESSAEYLEYINLFKSISLEVRKELLPFFMGVNESYEADMESFRLSPGRSFKCFSSENQLSRWLN